MFPRASRTLWREAATVSAHKGTSTWRGRGRQVAGFDESCTTWRKSTASNSGACVEVAVAGGSVLIRDSKNPDGPMLRASAAAWFLLLASAREEAFGYRQQ